MDMISTEMDKSRDVRRVTSRFSRQQINNTSNKQQQSRPNLIFGVGGDFVCLEKPKKEKIRRLSSVNGNRGSPTPCPYSNQRCETEMGSCCCCDLSPDNSESQCPSQSHHSSSLITSSTTKRFKIPKKFFDDCNVVDHASVPRKLRSAMKKRGCESISPPLPDSKKLNHTLGGGESHKKDGVKKPKLNLKQGESDWSRKGTVSGPITKDEEEVVETLYALAGMFPEGDSMDKNKLSGESMEVKSSAPLETSESPVTTREVKKEDTNSVCHPQAAETGPSATIEESSNEVAELISLNGPATQYQPGLPCSKKSRKEPDSTISQIRPNTTIPSLAKSESDAEKSSCIHGNFHVLSEPSLETGLKQPKQQVTNLFERKPEMAFGVTTVERQMAQQHMIEEPRKNGLALWPGLSSSVPLVAGRSPGGSSPSSATKIPAWLDAAMYGPRTCSLESGSSTEKVLEPNMDRKSMKRCATHVYISCLIRNLQMQDSKDSTLQQPFQLKPHLGLKQTALLYPNNCSNLRNGINGTMPSIRSGHSTTDRSSYEARSGILEKKLLHQEQPQVASASGMHTSERQSFDFLSLSAGCIGMEANNSPKIAGNAIESLQQLQVPYLHSLPQHQSLLPFSILSSRFTSSAYTDQLSAGKAAQQVQLHLPQYLSNPYCGPPYTSQSGVAKPQQQQQQQQRFWAAHLAAQYRPGGTSAVFTQFPSWPNGKPESSTLMPCAQTAIPPHSTLDAVGPKYNTVPQYQQPKVAISSSLPPARFKRPDHHIPYLLEEGSDGFRAAGPSPLQLLCNERF
ncbi:uncharacterized protein LOC111312805 isoform X2 [Durio zibethinus]|uniref:Uncharacterized protein LOC111312805 isoform X2 n=1 Tax=Durio zibethinus TaxID=66656 RepID=A0A6P6AWA2_DURZI|nr:uncharacterized protein LOC111312805 isoform X2 [Durio zibethinus]